MKCYVSSKGGYHGFGLMRWTSWTNMEAGEAPDEEGAFPRDHASGLESNAFRYKTAQFTQNCPRWRRR